jgi:hypothetical protein
VEAPRIADFVRSQSAAGDTIAVLGSEPEIYFYADRRSATGYVYMYPLMEPQPFASTMQKEMISEIQAARPNVLVYVDCVTSWIPFPKSDRSIFFWAEEYVQAGYRQVGVADMFDDKTEYHFGDGAVYHPRAVSRVFVFKRKP